MTWTEAAARAALLRRRDEIMQAQTATREDRAPVELDQASIGRLSRMDALHRQAMAEAGARSRDRELARIDAALRRIDDGTYGDCLKCGDEIPGKRLSLDPSTAYCVACASGR